MILFRNIHPPEKPDKPDKFRNARERGIVDRFSIISEFVHASFHARNQARDQALTQARQVIRHASQAIRAIHRMDVPEVANQCISPKAASWSTS